jgi:predicted AAA+ superfamily ATPase
MSALAAQNPWWRGGRPVRTFERARALLGPLLDRLRDPAQRRAALLIGPRQVGKSVLLRQVADELLRAGWPAANLTYFDFEDHRLGRAAGELDPALVEQHLPEGHREELPRVLLLDEVHRANGWDIWLKKLVDRERGPGRPGVRVLATDSAASMLRHGTRESGQGRWDEIRILGLTFGEYLMLLSRGPETPEQTLQRNPQELERYLAKGGFPEHVHVEPSSELWWKIREDVASRTVSQDLFVSASRGADERLDVERLRRLFVMLVQDSGAIFGATERATDLGAHRTTVSSWLALLEDACLVHRIEPYQPTSRAGLPSAKSRLARKPKIHAAEHGLVPAFVLSAYPMKEAIVRDRVCEAVVLRHLLEGRRPGEIHYYRRAEDLEIDFVLEVAGRRVALEVTSSGELGSRKRGRFSKACDEMGAERRLIVHGGADSRTDGDARLVALHRFLLSTEEFLA